MEEVRYLVPILFIFVYAIINEVVGNKYGEVAAFVAFCIFLLIFLSFIFYYC